MSLQVVGAGVGRTGTLSLKLALERLLGGPCHHMLEIIANPSQLPGWIDAIEGVPVDWDAMLARYRALVDWPGCSFWPELTATNPDALVVLSVRDPHAWYTSASNTIFVPLQETAPPEMQHWREALYKLFRDRFSDRFDEPATMIDAFERHNQAVRDTIPAARLLEWTPPDGWEPLCDRLGVPVPDEPFPATNSTNEFRSMMGLPPLS